MTLFSMEFVAELLLFLPLYWIFAARPRVQNLLLLIFSYLFYAQVNPRFALTIAGYTLGVYLCACLTAHCRRRLVMLPCVGLAVMTLSFFKYYDSLFELYASLFVAEGEMPPQLLVLMPVGLSFYVFASITYLVNVYRGDRPESLLAVAAYLSFFPTVLMGPIVRSRKFFSQYHAEVPRHPGDLNQILTLLLFAAVKKLILAGYLSMLVPQILNAPGEHGPLVLATGLFAYSFLIYFDFSGYVDLVTALALMIGFRLPPNFRRPYESADLQEFWQRWHISLSYFIRDYVYIPLGGSRHGLFLTCLNLLAAMGISGLWHGNTLNFLFWGLLHGAGLVFLRLRRGQGRLMSRSSASFVCFAYVTFCWLFFYYRDFEQSREFISAFVSNLDMPVTMRQILLFMLVPLAFWLYRRTGRLRVKVRLVMSLIPLVYKPLVLAAAAFLTVYIMPDGIPGFIYENF